RRSFWRLRCLIRSARTSTIHRARVPAPERRTSIAGVAMAPWSVSTPTKSCSAGGPGDRSNVDMDSDYFHDRVVGIVDYQAGNIHSISNAFAHLGARTVHVRAAGDMAACSHLVLPGVGAFGFCAERLQSSGLTESIRRWALEQHRPLLGICVG